MDFLYLAGIGLFFTLLAGLVVGCSKLGGKS